MTLDAWGHLGYGLIFIGMYLLGTKVQLGWVARFLGDAIWVVVGIAMGMSSIWAWGLVFMLNDVLSYRKWSIIGSPVSERAAVALIFTTGDSLESIAKQIDKDARLTDVEKKELMKTVIDSVRHR